MLDAARIGVAPRRALRGSLLGVVALLATSGCAHAPVAPAAPLSLADQHLREGFRRPLPGGALVLPILDCSARSLDSWMPWMFFHQK